MFLPLEIALCKIYLSPFGEILLPVVLLHNSEPLRVVVSLDSDLRGANISSSFLSGAEFMMLPHRCVPHKSLQSRLNSISSRIARVS